MAMNTNTGNSGMVKAETEVQNSGKIRVSEIRTSERNYLRQFHYKFI